MHRIVSCYSNCFGPAGVWAAVESIHSASLNYLELAMRGHALGGLIIPEEVVVTERADDATATRFLDHLRQHQVHVSGCNVGGADMRTTDGIDLVIRRIAFAKRWFGVSVVVSGAGQPENQAERQAVISGLRRLGDFAAGQGVTVALETHKGPTQNADSMLEIIQDVNHDQIRLNFDTGNLAYYNAGVDVVAELKKVAPLVRNVHLKDNRGQFEDWYFPAVGEGGAVDFFGVRETLDAVGFQGPYTIEIEGIGGEPEPGPEERLRRISASVNHLKACGYFS